MPLPTFLTYLAAPAALAALALLAGCAGGPAIDRTYVSAAQDSRVRYVILHYTHGDLARSFQVLTTGPVSSHYLISAGRAPAIYQLVDEQRRAWHAGDSAWKKDAQLNFSSIGIELVHPGYRDTPHGRVYFNYAPEQIELLIALLRQIAARHGIAPEHILGHQEIAPGRKLDPGPMFPWEKLAQAGLIPWPDAKAVARHQEAYTAQLPDATWFQRKLAQHGYVLAITGTWDERTRQVMAAFQARFRPARHDGAADAETAALLEALNPDGTASP